LAAGCDSADRNPNGIEINADRTIGNAIRYLVFRLKGRVHPQAFCARQVVAGNERQKARHVPHAERLRLLAPEDLCDRASTAAAFLRVPHIDPTQ
jgi:hypothetical protein